jgi:hypothetical protein
VKLTEEQWDIGHLHEHLQAAAELEAWTIPYYLSAMFSVVDRSSEAYQLVQSVVNQEMLHLQLVANIANSYGYSPVLTPGEFVYAGDRVPHLDFTLDPDNPIPQFTPYTAEIGPLDQPRVNAMCLIEYPEWDTGGKPDYQDDVTDYGSIGEFYDALEYGARQLADHIAGGLNQVDLFSAFYRELPTMTVQTNGRTGWPEVQLLIDVIRDQGEAAKAADAIAAPFRNTADDPAAEQSHYEKFTQIRGAVLPEIYPVKDPSDYTEGDRKRRAILVADFARFTDAVSQLCAGRRPRDFETLMVTLGGDILACWKSGVTPEFTEPGQPPVGAFA